jgi:hypothetical protein
MATGRINVAPGQIVASDWGNKAWDHTVQCFASTADRDTQFPAPHNGAMAFTEAEKAFWVRQSGAWVRMTAANATRLWSSMRTQTAAFAPATFNLLAGLTVTAAPSGLYLILGSVVHTRPASNQTGYTRITVGAQGAGDRAYTSVQYDNFTVIHAQAWGGGDLTVNLYSQLPVAYNGEAGCQLIVIGV